MSDAQLAAPSLYAKLTRWEQAYVDRWYSRNAEYVRQQGMGAMSWDRIRSAYIEGTFSAAFSVVGIMTILGIIGLAIGASDFIAALSVISAVGLAAAFSLLIMALLRVKQVAAYFSTHHHG